MISNKFSRLAIKNCEKKIPSLFLLEFLIFLPRINSYFLTCLFSSELRKPAPIRHPRWRYQRHDHNLNPDFSSFSYDRPKRCAIVYILLSCVRVPLGEHRIVLFVGKKRKNNKFKNFVLFFSLARKLECKITKEGCENVSYPWVDVEQSWNHLRRQFSWVSQDLSSAERFPSRVLVAEREKIEISLKLLEKTGISVLERIEKIGNKLFITHPETVLSSGRFLGTVSLQVFDHSHQSSIRFFYVLELLLQFENQTNVHGWRLWWSVRFRWRFTCRLSFAVRWTVRSLLIPIDRLDPRIRSRRRGCRPNGSVSEILISKIDENQFSVRVFHHCFFFWAINC